MGGQGMREGWREGGGKGVTGVCIGALPSELTRQ